MKKGGISPRLKKLTMSAMLAAIGVIFNCAGNLIEMLELTTAMLSSMLIMLALIEFGGIYPWLIYFAVGILSVALFPQGVACWVFVAYLGYYPMLKKASEKLPRPIAWIIKLASLNLALGLVVLVLNIVFFGFGSFDTLPEAFFKIFGDPMFGKWFAYLFYATINVVFVVYDIALSKAIVFYYVKLRERFKFLR